MKLQRFFCALCAAGAATSAATIAHADTWTTLNADGSVTKTEMNAAGQVKSTSTTPAAPTVRRSRNTATFTARDSRSGNSRRDNSSWDDDRWDNDRDDDRDHRRDQNGVSVYQYYPGAYVQTYPYSFQLPGFAPFGGPVISVLPQAGIQSYPAYPVYGCPVPVNPYPVYGYPYPANQYPVYNYPSYPVYANPYGNGTYGSSTTYGGITLGSGGLNITIGGSRTRTTTSTSIWDQ